MPYVVFRKDIVYKKTGDFDHVDIITVGIYFNMEEATRITLKRGGEISYKNEYGNPVTSEYIMKPVPCDDLDSIEKDIFSNGTTLSITKVENLDDTDSSDIVLTLSKNTPFGLTYKTSEIINDISIDGITQAVHRMSIAIKNEMDINNE